MNSYERVLAALDRQPTDRLAFMPITMMFAADQLQIPYGEYVTDYRQLVDAQLETARKFDIDHVSCISDPAREAADCGSNIHFFEDQPPAVDEANALLADKDRLTSLTIPDPLRKGSRMNDRVQAARLFAEKVKGKYFIEGWVEGPCAEAADLRGINRLMTDFIDHPDFVRQLFSFTLRLATEFAAAQIESGCDIIGVGDAAASLVGPKIYKNFVFPFEKQLVDNIHAAGGRVRLHICGNTNRSLADIGELHCDLVDLDSMVSFEKARQAMGGEQVLDGNIDPVNVLQNGTAEMIQAVLSECFQQAGGNYIVGAGCEVTRDTSPENVLVMRDFVRKAACSI